MPDEGDGLLRRVVDLRGDDGERWQNTDHDTLAVIRDYGLEWTPAIASIIGAVFLVGLTFYLIRRGLHRARGEMRF